MITPQKVLDRITKIPPDKWDLDLRTRAAKEKKATGWNTSVFRLEPRGPTIVFYHEAGVASPTHVLRMFWNHVCDRARAKKARKAA
jgi:hypothetical protein